MNILPKASFNNVDFPKLLLNSDDLPSILMCALIVSINFYTNNNEEYIIMD